MSNAKVELDGNQIAIIHIAKTQLKLTDEHYRYILSSFGVSSSKDLSFSQFLSIMDIFKKLGFKNNGKKKKEKSGMTEYEKAKNGIATEKQIAKIKAMWREKSREKTIPALESFVYRIVKKISLNILTYNDVKKLIRALENLQS